MVNFAIWIQEKAECIQFVPFEFMISMDQIEEEVNFSQTDISIIMLECYEIVNYIINEILWQFCSSLQFVIVNYWNSCAIWDEQRFQVQVIPCRLQRHICCSIYVPDCLVFSVPTYTNNKAICTIHQISKGSYIGES